MAAKKVNTPPAITLARYRDEYLLPLWHAYCSTQEHKETNK